MILQRGLRALLVLAAGAALFGMTATFAAAQQPATITGTVTDEAGQPMRGVTVSIDRLNVGTLTGRDGEYTLNVPAARFEEGETVLVRAQRLGYRSQERSVALSTGASVAQSFTLVPDALALEGVVAIGQGLRTTRERVGVTVSQVDASEIIQAQEPNIVAALAGKAPGVNVTSSSGDPGAGAYIRIRGANTIFAGTQPLFVIDGVPVNNQSNTVETTLAGTAVSNRLADINPNDIESIEILKGPAAGALYGSRAAAGVVLITTKSGQRGATRASFRSTLSTEEVNQTVPLHQSHGQGLALFPFGEEGVIPSVVTWGAPLDPGTQTFDHSRNIFRTGGVVENNLDLSGGTERTTYYLSVGHMDHQGVINGNSEFARTSARLRGSHAFAENLTVGGNLAYTNSRGDMVQQGSNISGLLLGALRTPPEYQNCRPGTCELTEDGLHHSYRNPNPTTVDEGRGYDNPFWIARRMPNTTDVGRTIGSVDFNYQPLQWLDLSYIFGMDYSSDDRQSIFPKGSSDFPSGRMIRANFTNQLWDSNLLATATRQLTPDIGARFTVGHNLNEERFSRTQVNGQTLILGADQLDFTVDQVPNEFRSRIRTDGYFGQASFDLFEQLFLTAGVRADGASTFGTETQNRFIYPKLDAAWTFTALEPFQNQDFLGFGKLRAAWGITGKQPPAYTNVTGYNVGTLTDGWLNPNGLYTIYRGQEGVFIQAAQGNQAIEPERTTGLDVGLELGFLDGLVDLNLTYYTETTEDVILTVPTAVSTGFTSRWDNGATIENSGWEVQLGLRPIRQNSFRWNVDLNYANNTSCVTDLAGAEFITLGGFTGSRVGLFRPDEDGTCHPYNTFYGQDFIRFGRGSTVGGVDIDEAFPGWQEGDVFIAEDGFPRQDPQERPMGSAEADWTASVRNTFTLFNNLTLSGLIDISQGNRMWNGTRGALYYFGTHADVAPAALPGADTVFAGHGPGAGQTVPLNWATWYIGGLGSGFTGPFTQFLEDASFVKLRDVSLTYTLDGMPFLDRMGLGSVDLTAAGRNLLTWTDYTGVDPESNLTGQSAARGLDYFHNPRTRSFTFSVQLNR